MRTKLLKASIIFALLAILLGMPLLAPHRIRPSSFALIQHGMTAPDLEELLGATPGEYDGYRARHLNFSSLIPSNWVSKKWCSQYGAINVLFDEKGRVMTWMTGESAADTWWSKLIDPYVRPEQHRRDMLRLQALKKMTQQSFTPNRN